MTEPDPSRPATSLATAAAATAMTSMPTRGPSLPPSPRPSVASRASRSSLRRDREWEPQLERDPDNGWEPPHHPDGPGRPPSTAPHPSPSFSPLFAIVASNTHPAAPRRNTHYPAMHYVFADDDPDMLTAALAHHHRNGVDYDGAEGVGGSGAGLSAAAGSYYADDDAARGLGPEGSGGASGWLGFGVAGGDANERAVILDVASPADAGLGLQVAWASSLSPDWAVVSADLSRMEDAAGRSSSSGALMLRIEGVSVDAGALPPSTMPLSEGDLPSVGTRQQQQRQQQRQQQQQQQRQQQRQQPPPAQPSHDPQHAAEVEYAGLIRDFEKRMGVLRRVVESGEERECALAAEDEAGETVGVDEGVGASGAIAPAMGEAAE